MFNPGRCPGLSHFAPLGRRKEGTGKAITEGAFYLLLLRGCGPSGVGGILWDTGGVASLNPRLMAVIPPGWGREERMKDEG